MPVAVSTLLKLRGERGDQAGIPLFLGPRGPLGIPPFVHLFARPQEKHGVFVFVFVVIFAFFFVIVITRASVDSACHDLSEYVWLYGSVKHT